MRGGPLPDALRARFAPTLAVALRTGQPTIAVNFVTTLDGVVAFDRSGATGGREVSGSFEPDRFLMGLLRASADAVLVGAGTVRASPAHVWSPAHVHPPSASSFAQWRRDLGLPGPAPTTVVVTASGDLPPGHPGLGNPDVPVIVATTATGFRRLRPLASRPHVEIVKVTSGRRVSAAGLLELLRDRGFSLVLCEGGPTLFGELLRDRVVDELFLTLAPQVAGRSHHEGRLSLVERVGFSIEDAPWARLRSVMHSGDHLFLRYDLSDRDQRGAR